MGAVPSLREICQPIDDALAKVQSDHGAAGAMKNNLESAASDLNGSAEAAKRNAGKVTADWSGGKAAQFEDQAPGAHKELDSAAADAKTVANQIQQGMDAVQTAKAQLDQLRGECASRAQPLIDQAKSAKDSVLVGLVNALNGIKANYAHAAAQLVSSAKDALSQIGSGGGGGGDTSPSSASAIGGGASSSPASPAGTSTSSGGGGGGAATDAASAGKARMVPPPQNNYNDGGTKVKLPDGKEVDAPNPRSAAATRAALSRLGLPYKWGGTDPKSGLDCSGLTQWAYGQAGVQLPRTSSQQHVGQKIPVEQAQPGDLYVWQGHVAMYIGDGKIVEEPQPGDVCHIRPARTSNAGDAFLGVFRPSA